MAPMLRLYEDTLSNLADPVGLPPVQRIIFVVHGAATIGGSVVSDGEVWHGETKAVLAPGVGGVTAWRFELATESTGDAPLFAVGIRSQLKLAARLDTLREGELLMRGDSVRFPPGGCAYLHCHQGPGIRCLIDGGIRIDTEGRSTSYGPGGAWYEPGPAPVFAQAAADRPSRFIRVLILPRTLLGKSSIQYVNEDDKAKPKSQQYRVFVDTPITCNPAD
ncbi:cupin domain-containing protein [Bradyrhizobium jicamae]|uniref:cupin domain-containing protein n=1 Tax=Bradyrhizobium jicamae TaxID=280332 RepID=UPI001BA6BF43|nr:hypothetical protein [Bradyrhizobium jicamae]MBR0938830.1 hypothetical protein [Bradyrhizobium jicamae]